MGGGNAKETNQMLGKQQQRTSDYTDTLRNYGSEDRKYQTGVRDFATQEYKNLYGQLGQDGGSGGGGGATLNLPGLRDNESLGTYRNFMNQGGYNDDQIRDFRSRSEAVIPSMFEGIKRNLNENANIRGGGYAGYSGQLAKLSREKVQQTEAGRLNSEVELQNSIRDNKLKGATGVERLDRERMGAEEGRAREMYQNANAAAGRGRASQDQNFRDRMAVLGEMRGLRGEEGTDLGYIDRTQRGMGMEGDLINSRVAQPSAFQTIASTVGGLAGAASPFLSSGVFKKDKPRIKNDGSMDGII